MLVFFNKIECVTLPIYSYFSPLCFINYMNVGLILFTWVYSQDKESKSFIRNSENIMEGIVVDFLITFIDNS